jgi:ABC-2 type transport system ATP-binding protein
MDYAVEIKKLNKIYKDIKALDGVSLDVPEGKIYGLIGPNGAGKTTLIRSMVGMLTPTSGSIKVMGLDPIQDRSSLRKIIGYMPQGPSLYEDLSARSNISFFAQAANIKNVDHRVSEVLELVELSHRSQHRVHTFSGGMKKRVSLACTLVHNPKILFLDEPTAAIDPELKQKLWELFRLLASNGTTLFISTNMIEEAMYCDQIAILREGKLLLVSSPKDFISHGSTKVDIVYSSGKTKEEIVKSDSRNITQLLKKYGLDEKIQAIDFIPDDFDKILLSLIRKEK